MAYLRFHSYPASDRKQNPNLASNPVLLWPHCALVWSGCRVPLCLCSCSSLCLGHSFITLACRLLFSFTSQLKCRIFGKVLSDLSYCSSQVIILFYLFIAYPLFAITYLCFYIFIIGSLTGM